MSPYTFNARFGIELEFIGNGLEVAARVNAAGEACNVERYNHTTRPQWKIVPDASVAGSVLAGGELVSPILEGEEGIRRAVVAARAAYGEGLARVDRRCGFHAHFDVSDFTLHQFKNLAKLWLKYEDVMEALVSPSRRGDSYYCRSNLSAFRLISDVDVSIADEKARRIDADRKAIARGFARINACRTLEEIAGLFGTRYRKLNFDAFFRHRTVEFRLHQGTLNAEKVEMWLRLLNFFLVSAKSARNITMRKDDGKHGAERLAGMFFGAEGAELRRYFTARARALA